MKLRKIAVFATALGALAAIACVTINVYFPEAAVKELAAQIEEAVEQQAQEEDTATEPEDTSAPEQNVRLLGVWAKDLLAHLAGAAPVYAQGDVAAPGISNPAIRAIISSRAKRAADLRKYKDRGTVGENRLALVEVRSLNGLALKERAEVQRLVKAENADRETMFKEIAAATGVDLSQLPQIQKTYAETIRQKAKKGDWIQQPDESWKQK